MSSKSKFTTVSAAKRLMESMEVAINNMIDEVKKPVDPEINGSARKAELQSIKQTATDCRELIIERQRLDQMIKDLNATGEIEGAKDYIRLFCSATFLALQGIQDLKYVLL